LAFALEVDPVVEGAVGSPLPGTDARLIDDEGNDVGYNSPGELLFRGENVMKGYFENPTATAEYKIFL
jgi:long-subunit acyl-CoA synthetase (AMP-forming)